MSDLTFDATGPEANNQRAAAFEDRLVAMGDTLGWATICRNVDVFIRNNGQSYGRGVDVLWAIQNPLTEQREGCIGEAKVHGAQAALSTVQDELQTLHDKVQRFNGQRTFWNNAYIAASLDTLRWGLLAHRTANFDAAKARHQLRNVELRERQRGPNAPAMFFCGPDVLEALADCLAVAGMPKRFYWPGNSSYDGEWARACPPAQLAAGLLAYEAENGEHVLWLRDTLTDKDPDALAQIARAWRLNLNRVVASELDEDTWRTVAAGWASTAERVADRRHGHLPETVMARDLSYARLNRFEETWPAAA